MAIKNLKENIEKERKIIDEINIFKNQLEDFKNMPGKENEIRMLENSLNASLKKLEIINDAVLELLGNISQYKKIGEKQENAKNLMSLSHKPKGGEEEKVTIKLKDRDDFLENLRIHEDSLKRLKKQVKKKEKKEKGGFKKPSLYAIISNKFFFKTSNTFEKNGYFKKLNLNLRKANMPYLLTTYLSMSFFTSLIVGFISLLYFISSFFISLNFTSSFIAQAEITFQSVVINFAIFLALPFLTFFMFYFYPSAEAKSLEGRINQELPFLTIHMSAIAGSGIEPSQIFKIISIGEEYKYTKKEIMKLINQVNVYGYDLVTSLKNTASQTSSKKLSELLNGFAAIISGGGSLTNFLDKRAETLLFDYRMEREKYNKSSETFMDIYIGVVIAAPMIMTLLLVLMNIGQIGVGLSTNALSYVMVLVVSLINILFLVFLHLNQPTY